MYETKMKKLNVETLVKDPICQKWIYFMQEPCVATNEWYQNKNKLWNNHLTYLDINGFQYDIKYNRALDHIEVLYFDNLDWNLFVVNVGSKDRPANKCDIKNTQKMLNNLFYGVKCVKVVSDHTLNVISDKQSHKQRRIVMADEITTKEKLNIEKLSQDPICQKWITYSTAEDINYPAEWFREKQSFWESNQKHLETNGFAYGTNIGGALDQIEFLKDDNLEGSLLVVKIGNDQRPASPDDINLAHTMLNDALEGVKGIRVIVTHHAFNISKISLPQLRSLQSAVLSSTDPTENVNPIVDIEI